MAKRLEMLETILFVFLRQKKGGFWMFAFTPENKEMSYLQGLTWLLEYM